MNKAIALMKKIAANNPEFHKGHSQLAELLIAGQAAACFTCYSHHFPGRIKKGAPLNYMLTEGVAAIGATARFQECAPSKHGPVVRPLDGQSGGTKSRWQRADEPLRTQR